MESEFFKKCYIELPNENSNFMDSILIDSYYRSTAYGYHAKFDEIQKKKLLSKNRPKYNEDEYENDFY
jgi:hypothetical protein